MKAEPLREFPHLAALAATEGMGVVKLLLRVTGLQLEVNGLRREVEELKARLKALEPHEIP